MKDQRKGPVLSCLRIELIVDWMTFQFGCYRSKRRLALRVRTQRYLTAEFLLFHIYSPVHLITTETNPTQNMNRKRKCLLNRSQEYQLQYLSAKEESFQQCRPFPPLSSTFHQVVVLQTKTVMDNYEMIPFRMG